MSIGVGEENLQLTTLIEGNRDMQGSIEDHETLGCHAGAFEGLNVVNPQPEFKYSYGLVDPRSRVAVGDLKKALDDMAFGEIGAMKTAKTWAYYTRGKLLGAADWSHQYGEPGNTASSGDKRIKGFDGNQR